MGEAIIFIINSNFAFRDYNPSATADGTDCFQVRFWTLEAKPPHYANNPIFRVIGNSSNPKISADSKFLYVIGQFDISIRTYFVSSLPGTPERLHSALALLALQLRSE
jgi:hypothetical protein